MEKTCPVCNINKSVAEFHFRKDQNKHRNECKACVRLRGKVYRDNNPDKIKELTKIQRIKHSERIKRKNKEWRDNNKEYVIYKVKEWRSENIDKIKIQRAEHYQLNKDRINEAKKVHYNNNKEKHKTRQRQYDLENKDKLRIARRKWENERLKNDIQYKLQKSLRGRIRAALKNVGGKNSETEELIGCSIEYFKYHIESLFVEGMSWDNWSLYGWHVDHKIPISWFNLENENCKRLAFNYTNMQPLWAEDNILKNNKYHECLSQ